MNNKSRCDICQRDAAWYADNVQYCRIHAPVEPKNRAKQNDKYIQTDPDAAFLISISNILSRAEITSGYATKLREIARKIQQPSDEKAILHRNLRKYGSAPAPAFNTKTTNAVVDEIRNAEYSKYNAIGRLNEIHQKTGVPAPKYSYLNNDNQLDPKHICTVVITTPKGRAMFSAQASKKKNAKQEAAIKALEFYLLENTKVGKAQR
jgi:hypothetical protein